MLLLLTSRAPLVYKHRSQEARRIATPCFLSVAVVDGTVFASLCLNQQKELYRYGSTLPVCVDRPRAHPNKPHDLHNPNALPGPSPLQNTSLATLPFHSPSSKHSRRSPRGDHHLPPFSLPDRDANSCQGFTARGNKSGIPPYFDRRTPRRRSPPIPIPIHFTGACPAAQLPAPSAISPARRPPTARRAAHRSSPEP